MSTQLPPIDLTGAIVGTVKTLDFSPFVKFDPSNFNKVANIEVFNESGCGLNISMQQSGHTKYIPAGMWGTIPVASNDSSMKLTVNYVLPNPPVSLFTAVYYQPNEEPPSGYTLGNSPIGIGGSVNVSTVQTLSNEGNAANTLVIDIGDVAFASLYTIFTDGHSLWSVDQSGTKHQVVKVQASGNPLQLGQAGDTSEVLGALTIDQVTTTTGNLIASGGMNINIIRDNVSGTDQIDLATAGITINNKATLNGATTDHAGPINFTSTGVNNAITRGGLEILAYNATNGDVEVKATATGGRVLLTTSDGTARAQIDSTGIVGLTGSIFFPVAGSFKSVTRFTGTGNGTVATGTTNPFSIANDACTVSGSSQTIGMTIASSSVVQTGAGLAWHGTAYN